MPVSIRFELAGPGKNPLDWSEVGAEIRDRYIESKAEQDRREQARKRHDLFHDRGGDQLDTYIDEIFSDPEVKKLRKVFIERARHNNVLRRVVNERAILYLRPAMRRVGKGDQKKYNELQRELRQDLVMRRAHQYLVLHRNLAFMFRTVAEIQVPANDNAVMEPAIRTPRLDILTPDQFSIITPRTDPLKPVGILILVNAEARGDEAKWLVWTAFERFHLTEKGLVKGEAVVEHGLGRMPVVLAHADVPTHALLDGSTGDDLVSAHMSTWLLNVMLLKESKSATKQVHYSGDTGRTPTGQTQDTEHDMFLGEDVTATVVDRGMNLKQFQEVSDHIVETAGANHGLPPAILRHDGAASGEEIRLRRLPLQELREQDELLFRYIERDLAELQALILQREIPERAFNADKWSINFSPPEVPLSRKEAAEVFEHERRLNLDSTIHFMMQQDPDLTEEQAFERLSQFIDDEVTRNQLMRPLQQMSDSANMELGEPKNSNGTSPDANEREDEDEEQEAA